MHSFMHPDWAPHGRVSADDIRKTAEELNLDIRWGETIEPGDLYLAGRNTGVKLLTCLMVHPKNWITPTTFDYPFDNWECVKVVEKVSQGEPT